MSKLYGKESELFQIFCRHRVVLPVTQQGQCPLYSWHPLGKLEQNLEKIYHMIVFFRWGEEGARETVRLSVGRDTTKQLIDKAVDALAAALLC